MKTLVSLIGGCAAVVAISVIGFLPAGAAENTATAEAFPEMRKFWDREPAAAKAADEKTEQAFRAAEKNGRAGAEGLYRCRKYVDGWIVHADPKTGLIPRGLGKGKWLHGVDTSDVWNGRDSGADNYPFMVLTCSLIDRPMFEGRMLDILNAEIKYCTRLDRLGDNYCFSRGAFLTEKPILDEMVFDNAEYVKDGLIPLTEWLGKSPWSDRAVALVEDIWKNAIVETPYGKLPTLNFEVNGDLLQASSRFYWLTGDKRFLDWATRLGDYYLLGDHHPTRNMKDLKLRDHGCEVINGLTELYAALKNVRPEKAEAYQKPIHEMFDCILARGRNEHGMLYDSFNPQTGEHSKGICDTWGYNYDGFYTVYLLDKTEPYREAVRRALGNLHVYTNYAWEGTSSDGYADSIESAINLYNREPMESTAGWIDSEIRVMWAKQKANGVIEGWHGDGNFARTTVMYVLWKTQGIHVEPWRADVRVGAVKEGDQVLISLAADQPWSGKIVFDRPRHKTNFHLPVDYPRINQFAEWFTVSEGTAYDVRDMADGKSTVYDGKHLAVGVELSLQEKVEKRLAVSQKSCELVPDLKLSDTFKRLKAPGTGRAAIQLTSGSEACYPLYYFIPSISRDGRYLVYHRYENKAVQLHRLNLQTGESVQITKAAGENTDWRPWQKEPGLKGIMDYRGLLNVARNLVVYFDRNTAHSVDLETLKDEVLFELPADREPIGQNCTTPDGKWMVYLHSPTGSAQPKPCKGAVVAGYNFETKAQKVLCTIDSPVHHVMPYDNEHFIVNHPPGHNGIIFTDLTSGKWSELRHGDPGVKGDSCHQLPTSRGISYEVFGCGPTVVSGLYDPVARKRFEFRLPPEFAYTHTGMDPECRVWYWETTGKAGHSLWYLEKLDRQAGGVFKPLTGNWPNATGGQRGHCHPRLTPDRKWIIFTGGDENKKSQVFLLDVSDLKDTVGIGDALLSATGENDVMTPGLLSKE